MSVPRPSPASQGAPFQRFTIRLVDGRFVRVPKSDVPSVETTRQTLASNQSEIRDLFQLVNGRFQRTTEPDPAHPPVPPAAPAPARSFPLDPTFDLPADLYLPVTG